MSPVQMILGIVVLSLGIASFVISCRQFQEKGCLFHNAYIWASKEERRQMDRNREIKRFHYRQSGCIFMLIGFIFMADAAYIVTDWAWTSAASWMFAVITMAYAVVSSVQKK